jgi:hypothetical protein
MPVPLLVMKLNYIWLCSVCTKVNGICCSHYSEFFGDNREIGVRFTAKGIPFMFSPQQCPDQFWGPPSPHPLSSGYRGYIPGVNRLVLEARHSPLSRAMYMNAWIYTSISPYTFIILNWAQGRLCFYLYILLHPSICCSTALCWSLAAFPVS